MLPIARRELLTAARHPKLYRSRLYAGIAETLLAMLLFLSGRGRGTANGFFFFLSALAMVFCLVDGLRKAADSISEEKREGTLGLLFLGGLNGMNIVLGKLTSSLVRSINSLLAFLPILAIALLFGGTTGGEFWRTVLVLCATLIASTAVSLLVSAASRDESTISAFVALLALCAVPAILGKILLRNLSGSFGEALSNVSPVALLNSASDASYLRRPEVFWCGLGGLLLVSCSSLSLAGFLLPRWWLRDIPGARRSPKRARAAVRRQRRRALLDENPFYWLSFEPRQFRRFSLCIVLISLGWGIFGLVLLTQGAGFYKGAAVLGSLSFVVLLVTAIRTARQASAMFVEARRSGFLELALSSAMEPKDILEGHWMALRRTIVPIAIFCAGLWLLALFANRRIEIFWMAKYLLEGIFELYVLGWVGAWMGLTSKTPGRALFSTIILGILAPYLFCTPTLLNQFVLARYAKRKIGFSFRTFLADRYAAVDVLRIGRGPLPHSSAPPVIR